MSQQTSIEWTESTWNPVTGCSKVSPGCAHCYAETMTAMRAGQPGWIEEHRPWTPENAEHNVVLRPERLDQPLHWRRPRMVFVNSMSDLFHELVPDRFVAEVFAVMALAEHHTFQVLTKRPDRMRVLLNDPMWWAVVEGSAQRIWAERHNGQDPSMWLAVHGPLRNVWLGTSIENRQFVDRADLLRETPAAVRFISAEPLLGPLIAPMWKNNAPLWNAGKRGPQLDLTGIDWLIVGGESGPEHRPMDRQWARDLRDACTLIPAESREGKPMRPAFFFKQWGGRTPKAGGRLLDGREWSEMPVAA